MTTRLYFLVNDEAAARAVVDGLKTEDIGEDAISAVAHRDRYPLEGVPEGGIAERTDVLPAAGRGAAMTAAGAAFGTWSATLVGVGVLHRDLKPFEEAIEAGRILVLVDVDDARVDEVTAAIREQAADVVVSQGDLAQAS